MSLVVGVIGGLGPAATIQYQARVLALTPATREADHLRLIVDCNPGLPNLEDAVSGRGPSPAPALAAMARGLEQAGAQILAMPCNAAHAFAAEIEAAVSIPFLNLITAVADAAASPGASIGVLAADACLDAGLYQQAFGDRGAEVLIGGAAERARFMQLLQRIKAGDLSAEVRVGMQELAENLVERGAETIVAGCTEVPLVLAARDLPVAFADSIEILAQATVRAAFTA